ncbi:MAG TPA: type IV toxin-antitoxin system AbiEi family antitoxin domain-containing protein [Bacteroidales bacterium]|nr:type IV toxin-antitoxin system AbiEi family antitoxin domain-containing protein [Bacteroidales bacterium]HRW34687.1 type IV toxin-antitoxin system AbiEi family antitoxin domain-containing protein [Thermotogota bacterium]
MDGKKGIYQEKIEKAINENNGIITTSYFKENNIPRIYLTKMVKEGTLTRVGRGIYLCENGDYDDYYFFQLTYKNCIYSYTSSLYLHDLIDKIPEFKEITVYNNYNTSPFNKDVFVHYVKKELFQVGITEVKTMFDNPVKVYDKERTICDLIKNRKDIESEIFVKALNNYMKRKDIKINKLIEYSKIFSIEDKAVEILEVLYE